MPIVGGQPPLAPDPSAPPATVNNEYYFSYDESASTAPYDLSINAIDNNRFADAAWGRPYEFLNAETFVHFKPEPVGPFEVSMGLYPAAAGELLPQGNNGTIEYALGVNISGPSLSKAERRNVVLTLVLDISGSMSANYSRTVPHDEQQSLLEVGQSALKHVLSSLKEGDVLNLITFESSAYLELKAWQFSEDATPYLEEVEDLCPVGSTNLDHGIALAYEIARDTFDPDKANRVVMLTDAYANINQTNPEMIANNTVIEGGEGIYFSGIGIGENFQEDFLNALTDVGNGAYAAMITPQDAQRLFTDDFVRLIDNAANNVKFKLSFPAALDFIQEQTASEDVGETEDSVSASHFAYNSEQFFLEFFRSEMALDDAAEFELTVMYDDAEGERVSHSLKLPAAQLLQAEPDAIFKAAGVTALAKLIGRQWSCADTTALGLWDIDTNNIELAQYHDWVLAACNEESNVLGSSIGSTSSSSTSSTSTSSTTSTTSTSSTSTSSSTTSTTSSGGWGSSASTSSSSGSASSSSSGG